MLLGTVTPMNDRDMLDIRERIKTGADRQAPALRVGSLPVLLVGALIGTGAFLPLTQGADNDGTSNTVQVATTNRLGIAAGIGTNDPRGVGPQLTNRPSDKAKGPALDASISNSNWSLSDVLSLPSEHTTATNRLLDFPAWDDVTNSLSTDGRASKGNRRMHSR